VTHEMGFGKGVAMLIGCMHGGFTKMELGDYSLVYPYNCMTLFVATL